jgi:hypothetical protein
MFGRLKIKDDSFYIMRNVDVGHVTCKRLDGDFRGLWRGVHHGSLELFWNDKGNEISTHKHQYALIRSASKREIETYLREYPFSGF